MKMLWGSAAILVAASTPAFGQVVNSKMVGDWYIAEVRSRTFPAPQCWTSNNKFSDGTTLKIDVDTADMGFKLAFENPDWVSLPGHPSTDAEMQMPTKLTFEGTDQVYQGEFRGWRGLTAYGMKPQLSRQFQSSEVSTIFPAMGKATALILEVNGKVVGRYPMQASGAAMQETLACAHRVIAERQQRLDNDPFRK